MAGVTGDSLGRALPQSNPQADFIRVEATLHQPHLTNDESEREGGSSPDPQEINNHHSFWNRNHRIQNRSRLLHSSCPRTATGRRKGLDHDNIQIWIRPRGRRTTGAGLRYEALHHNPRTNWNTMANIYFLINLELVYWLAGVAK